MTPTRIKDAPALHVDGVKFFFYKCDGGDGLKSEDGKIIITPEQGNRRVERTYRARFVSPGNGTFLRDIYSKRSGRVRIFNFHHSAARVAIQMLKIAEMEAREHGG